VSEIAEAVAPEAERVSIGIRPGEKLSEVLLTEDESRHTHELEDCYVIHPEFPLWRDDPYLQGDPVPEGFRYSSDTNPVQLTAEELRAMLPSLQMVP
jgi:UDP-N-acetylglucosamine 4,6-dehydratase